MLTRYPLTLQGGHLYVEIGKSVYLIDTGSPVSFTDNGLLDIGHHHFNLPDELPGLTLESLRQYVRTSNVHGLLGNDVLGKFWHVWDLPGGTTHLADECIDLSGETLPRIPLAIGTHPSFDVRVGNRIYPSIFDTGAQISYMPQGVLELFPDAGEFEDFHASKGRYTSPTSMVQMKIGEVPLRIRCASYDALGWNTRQHGIIGNDLIKNRVTGYFPRSGQLVLS